MTPILETPRLVLHPLALEDAVQTQLLFPKWEVVRYLRDVIPWPYPPDGAHTHYRDFALPAITRGETWIWTLRLKTAPDRVIGAIDLMRGEHENRGFWLGLPWHGQGLMTEASNVATDYWFDVLGFEVMRVPKAIENKASRRISERCGMRIVGAGIRGYVSGQLPAETWEITAQEWRVWRAKSAPQ